MNRKYLIALVSALLLSLAAVFMLRGVIRNPSVRLSQKDAFQESAFDLTMKSNLLGGRIHYTLDGSNPTLESAVYKTPIRVEEGLPLGVTVVKAAVEHAGKLGAVTTQTYFVGDGVSKLYDVMLVSLTAEEEDLYSRETGIITNWDKTAEDGDWERPAYIEFYEADGSKMLAQGTGIAVSGHGSRSYDQKSFKLIADSKYDPEHPTFDFDFFEADMGGNTEGQSYDKLVLRNGGSDHNDETMCGTMVRWNVVNRLAKESGIICASARPGILFLNGSFYGIIQLQEKYSRYNVSHAIGAQKDDIEKFENNEVTCSRFGGYYNHLHLDLNDPESRSRLEKRVDIEDMLKHYAVNLIMNNVDWPYHNYLTWRCNETPYSPLGDGRVRFFLYDLDAVYTDTTKAETDNAFRYLMEEPLVDSTDTFSLLMGSDHYRQRFIDLSEDLMEHAFKEEHVLKILDEELAKVSHSMDLYYNETEMSNQKEAVREMREAVGHSCKDMRNGLTKFLGK